MPITTTTYRLFLSMPSDLNKDISSIEDAIAELNLVWGKQNNIVLELLHWKKNAIPGASIGTVQDLLNKEVACDYDLYIGIMWKRFGTPTGVAESGTEEEFNNALQKFKSNPNGCQILFYFSNAPIPPNDIDLEQLKKVKEFKQKLGALGVLYSEYSTVDELVALLKSHIPVRINGLSVIQCQEQNEQLITTTPFEEVIQEINNEDFVDESDFGIIEYREIFDSSIKVSVASLGRITKATETIGTRTNKKAEQISALSLNPNPSIATMKGIFRAQAKYMDEYSQTLDQEMSIWYPALERALNAGAQLINLSNYRHDSDDLQNIINSKDAAIEMRQALEEGMKSNLGYLSAVVELPKMTIELNKSKKRLINTLEQFIEQQQSGLRLIASLIETYNSAIDVIATVK